MENINDMFTEKEWNEYKPNNIYNVDCYKAIKKIPDKSIDLVYIDIPYLIDDGGCSKNELSQRAKRLRTIELEDIRHGIDYSIFDDLVRVMKYIYIYGVIKIKYMILLNTLLKKNVIMKLWFGVKLILHH